MATDHRGQRRIVVSGWKSAHANQKVSTCCTRGSRDPVSGPSSATPSTVQVEPVCVSMNASPRRSNVSRCPSTTGEKAPVTPTSRPAAMVAVPTYLHEEVALALCEAGVHTMVEKPIAATVADAPERTRWRSVLPESRKPSPA